MTTSIVSVDGETVTEEVPCEEVLTHRRAVRRAGRKITLSVMGGRGYYVTSAPDER